MAEVLQQQMNNMKISSKKKNAVFCFGRFQPPTHDHKKLAMRVMKEAVEKNADPWIFSSVSENKKKWREEEKNKYTKMKGMGIFCSHRANENPIEYETKLSIMRQLWSDLIDQGLNVYNSNDPDNKIRNVNDIVKFLKYTKKYTKIYLIFGEDRFIKGSFDEFYKDGRIDDFIVILRDENLISGTKARMGALQIFQPIVGGKILSKFVFIWDNQETNLRNYAENYLGYDPDNIDFNIVKQIIESIWEGIVDQTNRLDIFEWVTNWNIAQTKGKCVRLFDTSVSKGISQAQQKREQTSNRTNKPYLRSAITAVMRKKEKMKIERDKFQSRRKKVASQDNNAKISEASMTMKRDSLQELTSQTRRNKYFADKEATSGEGMETRVPGVQLTAVMTFGRFQPPHKGHGSLIKMVHDEAIPYNGDPYIFTSNRYDFIDPKGTISQVEFDKFLKRNTSKLNRNPLLPEQKIFYLQKLYPQFKDSIATKATYDNIKSWYKNITPFTVSNWLLEQGYTRIIMIVGADRKNDMESLMEYIKDLGGVAVLKAKPRTEESISGTRMRNYAVNGNFEEFKTNIQSETSELTEEELEKFMKILAKQTKNKVPRTDRLKNRNTKKKDTTGGRKKRTRKRRGRGQTPSRRVHPAPQQQQEEEEEEEEQPPQEQQQQPQQRRRRRRTPRARRTTVQPYRFRRRSTAPRRNRQREAIYQEQNLDRNTIANEAIEYIITNSNNGEEAIQALGGRQRIRNMMIADQIQDNNLTAHVLALRYIPRPTGYIAASTGIKRGATHTTDQGSTGSTFSGGRRTRRRRNKYRIRTRKH